MSYPPRHFASAEAIKQRESLLTVDHVTHLQEQGYCIIENVLTPEECASTQAAFDSFLIGLGTGLTKDALSTGNVKSTQLPYNLHGIIEYPRMVGPEVMNIRFNRNVNKIFSALWDVAPKDLVTSEDRACYMPRAKEAPPAYRPWLHIDQGNTMPGLQCVQGVVTACDVSDNGGTLVVVPGSHLHHDHLTVEADAYWEKTTGKKQKSAANRFVRIPETLMTWLQEKHQLVPKMIRPIKAGTMILWDSRTIHCNVQTMAEERMVVYTCQVPRKWAAEAKGKQLEKKQKAFLAARNTSHWPHYVKMFGTKPHTYGAPLRIFAKELSDEEHVVKRHREAFEQLMIKEGEGALEENTRLVRLAGFDSVANYNKAKNEPVKKRKLSSGEEKPKKKAKTKE